jgi:hypothetical protein
MSSIFLAYSAVFLFHRWIYLTCVTYDTHILWVTSWPCIVSTCRDTHARTWVDIWFMGRYCNMQIAEFSSFRSCYVVLSQVPQFHDWRELLLMRCRFDFCCNGDRWRNCTVLYYIVIMTLMVCTTTSLAYWCSGNNQCSLIRLWKSSCKVLVGSLAKLHKIESLLVISAQTMWKLIFKAQWSNSLWNLSHLIIYVQLSLWLFVLCFYILNVF